MRRAALRAFGAAGLLLVLMLIGRGATFVLLCEGGRAARLAAREPAAPVETGSYAVPRAGDALYLCGGTHCLGGGAPCHQELSCYCAPSGMPTDEVAREVERVGEARGVTCRAGEPTQRCRDGRCRRHLR